MKWWWLSDAMDPRKACFPSRSGCDIGLKICTRGALLEGWLIIAREGGLGIFVFACARRILSRGALLAGRLINTREGGLGVFHTRRSVFRDRGGIGFARSAAGTASKQ